jgi:hypothetical protein
MKSSETLWSTRGGGRGGRVCLAVVSGEPGEPGCAVAEKHQTEIEPGGGIDDAEFLWLEATFYLPPKLHLNLSTLT